MDFPTRSCGDHCKGGVAGGRNSPRTHGEEENVSWSAPTVGHCATVKETQEVCVVSQSRAAVMSLVSGVVGHLG